MLDSQDDTRASAESPQQVVVSGEGTSGALITIPLSYLKKDHADPLIAETAQRKPTPLHPAAEVSGLAAGW